MQQSGSFTERCINLMPSVHWHCWLGIQKSIQPGKNHMMRCWRGYLSRVRCKWFAYGLANATATPSSLASLKSRYVFTFWLTQVVLEKEAVKRVFICYISLWLYIVCSWPSLCVCFFLSCSFWVCYLCCLWMALLVTCRIGRKHFS